LVHRVATGALPVFRIAVAKEIGNKIERNEKIEMRIDSAETIQ